MESLDFEHLVDEALDSLPTYFRERLDNVAIVVEDWPDQQTLRLAGARRPGELQGFYHGIPLTDGTPLYGQTIAFDTGTHDWQFRERFVVPAKPIKAINVHCLLRKFGALMPIHSTNYIPRIVGEVCNGCGKCVNVCPVEAMTIVSANDPHKPNKRKAKLDEDVCLGCGVCTRVCPTKGLWLEARAERVITPINSTHRIVVMAIERGDLQDLIFDNRVLLSHRMMAAILGVILKLPPIKQALASQQMKSRYLENLIACVRI
jgi:ferredoxin